MNTESSIKAFSLYGLRVSQFTEKELLHEFRTAINIKQQVVCYGYSLTALPRFRAMPQIYEISESFEVMVADGKGFYYLCKLFGIPLKSDWALYEVTDALLELANSEGSAVMLLGSDECSNRRATLNLRKTYHRATILDGYHGYFKQTEEAEVVDFVNRLAPDILLIGISSPKKEEFVWRNREELNAPIIVLMGGVIDIYSGKTKRISRVVKHMCLTWLYRFVQEPRRTRNLVVNGMIVLFKLVPAMAWSKWIRRRLDFSIPEYFGVRVEKIEKLE